MSAESEFERLIAAMARGDSVDWDTAREHATSADDRSRIEALRGIERIAAFSHAQWEQFAPLVEQVLGRQASETQSGVAPGGPADLSMVGYTVGAYTLESPIGEGGMGSVWRARRSDGRFEASAAVKLLHRRRIERDGLARFKREGEILARLRHAHIAQLLDAGVAPGGQPYLILEYVDGVSIDRYCDLHGLDIRARIALFLDVLQAVAHAQANMVLHRDLKPSNVLVDHAGQVKLLDFGIAKLLDGDGIAAEETELTQRAGHAFTPEFAAPEQLRGEPVTTATDVYAAAVLLYVLLTGKHPTGGVRVSPAGRMEAILESTPKPASEAVLAAGDAEGPPGQSPARLRRELQGDLDNILAKALKKTPEERYANAAAFADDLRRYLNQEPVTARPDTIQYRVGKFVRRHRLAVASATFAVLALLGLTVVAISQLFEARRQRDEAQAQTQRAEAFNTVVTSLLSQTGPGGRALSPEEMLDHAVDEMQARYADDPPFLVDMLIRISGRYFDLRNSHKEYSTLVKAEEIARRAGDPSLVFDVQVNTVETEIALGRKLQAQQRIEEARQLLPKLDPTPPLHNYFRAEAEVARANDDIPAAVGYLEKARRAMEAEDRTHGNSYVGILSLLRRDYTTLGNLRAAHECAVIWADVEKRHRREGNVSGITSRAVLATSFYQLGEVVRALALYEEALPEMKAASSSASPSPSNSLAYGYGDVLSRLGRHDSALKLIHGGIGAVDRGGNQGLRLRSRMVLARALVRSGRTQEAQQTLDEVATIRAAIGSPDRAGLIDAARWRSEAYLAEHRFDEAAQQAHEALQLLGYPEKRRGPGLPHVLLTLSRVQLALGQPAAALEAARTAVELFESDALDPTQSADVGEALLELAGAEREAHDDRAAEKALQRAIPALRNGLGPEHPLVHRAEQLALGL